MGTINKISCWIATLGPIGYLPAPGTWGTLCAVPVMYALKNVYPPFTVLMTVIGFALIACVAVQYALPAFRQHDPSQIVIDEFVGFCALACTLPPDPILYAAGFLLFRFFDIAKPFGIKRLEHLDGTLGIMLDDLAAAGYAALCLLMIIHFLR